MNTFSKQNTNCITISARLSQWIEKNWHQAILHHYHQTVHIHQHYRCRVQLVTSCIQQRENRTTQSNTHKNLTNKTTSLTITSYTNMALLHFLIMHKSKQPIPNRKQITREKKKLIIIKTILAQSHLNVC